MSAAVDVFLNPVDYLAIAAIHSIPEYSQAVTYRRSGIGKQTALGVPGPGVRNPGYRQA